MYENAIRNKYRFPSSKGELTVEQLWDLPLTSARGTSLDEVAISVNGNLKNLPAESFVAHSTNAAAKAVLEEKLAIVVHIIQTKQAENEAARTAAERKQQRDRLTEILHVRTQQDLMSKTPEEIQAMIDALK